MLKTAAKVCAVILVITYLSEQCYSLSIHYEHADNNDLEPDEDLFVPETVNNIEKLYEEPVTKIPKEPEDNLFKLLLGGKSYKGDSDILNNRIDGESKYSDQEGEETAAKIRVIRQAHHAQAPLYPQLPTSQPYNQYQPYPNHNNSNQNLQWQTTSNFSPHGYPSNGVSNYYPSSTQQNSTYNHNPYNPSQGQNPYYNPHNPSSPSHNNTFNNVGPSRFPYSQHGQFNNNTYPAYQTPKYQTSNPVKFYSQRPPYSTTTPSNRHPVIYDHNSNRPSYNNQSSSHWPGNSNTNLRPAYNASTGQNPQYFNSYPNNPYGRPNSTVPHNVPIQGPYQNPSNGGQYPAYNYNNAAGSSYGQNPHNFNSYPQGSNQNPYNNPSNGQYGGGSTFNLATNGYHPSIPNQPPLGSRPGQDYNLHYPSGSNPISHDPTKVSPEYFSYPH